MGPIAFQPGRIREKGAYKPQLIVVVDHILFSHRDKLLQHHSY